MTSERQKNNGFPLPEQIADHDLLCVKLMIPNDPTYIADFVGHLYSLSKWWNWDKSYTDGDTRATRAAQYWGKLLDAFLQIDDCSGFSRICIDYKPDAVFVGYTPVDPFKDPTETPSGYLFPPWVVISPTDILGSFLGYQVGDVVTSVGRIPNLPAIITGNLPRILIDLPSGGDLTLDLLSIEFGGKADISVDGTVFKTVQLRHDVDLDRSDRVVQLEVNKLSDGPHKVEISFFPVITLDPPLILFGGGLRGFTFCSTFKNKPQVKVYEDTDDMPPIRIDCDCRVFVMCCDGTEVELAKASDVQKSGVSAEGEPQPAKNGGHQEYCKTWPSNAKLVIPTPVNSGDIITVTSVKGAANDGDGARWDCINGQQFFVVCGGSTRLVSTDPLPTTPHMTPIVSINGTFYAFTSGALTVPSGITNAQAFIQVNDSNLTNNSGDYEICVQVTNNQSGTWCSKTDFVITPGVGVGQTDTANCATTTWIAGVGFVSGHGGGCGGATTQYSTIVSGLLGSTQSVNAMRLKYHLDETPGTIYSVSIQGLLSGVLIHQDTTIPTTVGDHDVTVAFGVSIDKWLFVISANGSVGANIQLSSIELSGPGANPFGTDNC